ncbi:hypothetical protein F5Y17DRAFT_465133 [Xylariaceae sp. FL0594]|nr:hypothetical protein F5Y17DRAFT_465133 [Xylariaceae sp. FL0594]
MMNGFPGGPRSAGGPSPPPSVGRSSTYARSESGRSIREDNTEAILGEHYVALRKYLASTSKDGRANPPPNKARDKLLRLSSVQFLELSTDVFDELMRRQMKRPPPGAPPHAGPPPHLVAEPNFHPKRNQARQKLSTLGSPRFRDLATDVFCELERRIPAFVAGVTSRISTTGAPPSRTGTPVNGMGLPRGPNAMRRPSDTSSVRSAGPPRVPSDYPVPPSPGLPPNGNFERPQPKQFQSNTIVPNKSTMVEEDDDGMGSNEDDNDGYAPRAQEIRAEPLGNSSEPLGNRSEVNADKKIIEDYQNQVRALRERLEGMETEMKKRDEDMRKREEEIAAKERSQIAASNTEKKEWENVRTGLEAQVASLREDLERARDEHAAESRALREELEEAQDNRRGVADLATMQENEELRLALKEQEQVVEEARREARQFLEEMRALSQQHMASWERQSELERTVQHLEQEVHDWKNRYARAKTQLGSMRAPSFGLAVDDATQYLKDKGIIDPEGAIKDVHVTRFQISIDDLLRRARTEPMSTELMRLLDDCMKSVIGNVRRITKDMDGCQFDEEVMRQLQKLKRSFSLAAENLITACKNYWSAAGLSPVSLLDAAASHVVAYLVKLMRIVKVRITPAAELEDDEDDSVTPVESVGSVIASQSDPYPNQAQAGSPLAPPPAFQGLRAGLRSSAASSTYSPYNSPRVSIHSGPPSARLNGQVNGHSAVPYHGPDKGFSTGHNGYGSHDGLQDEETVGDLVKSIRVAAPTKEINGQIAVIVEIVSEVITVTERSLPAGDVLDRLSSCRKRLLEAGGQGKDMPINDLGKSNRRKWREWTQALALVTSEIVSGTKELVQLIDHTLVSSRTGGARLDD